MGQQYLQAQCHWFDSQFLFATCSGVYRYSKTLNLHNSANMYCKEINKWSQHNSFLRYVVFSNTWMTIAVLEHHQTTTIFTCMQHVPFCVPFILLELIGANVLCFWLSFILLLRNLVAAPGSFLFLPRSSKVCCGPQEPGLATPDLHKKLSAKFYLLFYSSLFVNQTLSKTVLRMHVCILNVNSLLFLLCFSSHWICLTTTRMWSHTCRQVPSTVWLSLRKEPLILSLSQVNLTVPSPALLHPRAQARVRHCYLTPTVTVLQWNLDNAEPVNLNMLNDEAQPSSS